MYIQLVDSEKWKGTGIPVNTLLLVRMPFTLFFVHSSIVALLQLLNEPAHFHQPCVLALHGGFHTGYIPLNRMYGVSDSSSNSLVELGQREIGLTCILLFSLIGFYKNSISIRTHRSNPMLLAVKGTINCPRVPETVTARPFGAWNIVDHQAP